MVGAQYAALPGIRRVPFQQSISFYIFHGQEGAGKAVAEKAQRNPGVGGFVVADYAPGDWFCRILLRATNAGPIYKPTCLAGFQRLLNAHWEDRNGTKNTELYAVDP